MQTASLTLNGIDVEKLSNTMNTVKTDPALGKFQVSLDNQWVDAGYNQSVIGDFYALGKKGHRSVPFIVANDEPEVLLGSDHAPGPVEYLLHALAGCVTSSIIYHAAARGYKIKKLTTNLEGEIDLRGFFGIDHTVRKGYEHIHITFELEGDFDDEQKNEILKLTSFSPVLDIVTNGVPVTICLGSKVEESILDC